MPLRRVKLKVRFYVVEPSGDASWGGQGFPYEVVGSKLTDCSPAFAPNLSFFRKPLVIAEATAQGHCVAVHLVDFESPLFTASTDGEIEEMLLSDEEGVATPPTSPATAISRSSVHSGSYIEAFTFETPALQKNHASAREFTSADSTRAFEIVASVRPSSGPLSASPP